MSSSRKTRRRTLRKRCVGSWRSLGRPCEYRRSRLGHLSGGELRSPSQAPTTTTSLRSPRELTASIATIDGVINLESDVTEARTEVDPEKAALVGLTTQQVGLQLSQYLIGQRVTTINIDGDTVDVVLSGDPRAAVGIEQLKSLIIVGPGAPSRLATWRNPSCAKGRCQSLERTACGLPASQAT